MKGNAPELSMRMTCGSEKIAAGPQLDSPGTRAAALAWARIRRSTRRVPARPGNRAAAFRQQRVDEPTRSHERKA